MQKNFSGILMGIGILIAGVSGLCSIGGIVSLLGDSDPLGRSIAEMILVISGIILAIGIGLLFFGRHLLRRANQSGESPQGQSDTFK
jgi:hypothetical protein